MRRIDRYELRDAIAETGSGEVCTAFDPVIERTVVVKTLDRSRLPPVEAADMVARFRREAIAAGRLTHPGIVTIYEYGEAGDLCFIAMEHARGPTLREFLAQQPTPPLPLVLAIARQLFAALIYAHEQGVLHRDLKPSNIVLAGAAGEPPRPKILDFGIARINSVAAVTQAGMIVGTPGYMAPEQYLGDPTDARTDIYALGVTLFEMLTGRRTFEGDFAQVVEQVLARDAPAASSLRPGLPTGVDAVLAKALARQPAARYATMREFREAFVRALPAVALQPAAAPAPLPPPAPSEGAEVPTVALPAHAGARTSERPKLLLLDDEERILGALAALFRLKYDLLVSTDGHAALELVRKHRPEVIISDQRMPQMPGVEFLRLAREIDASSVRILLTGYSDLAAIVGSINEGEVFRFVNKPWGNQELKDTVAQAMEIARVTRQAAAVPVAASTVTLPATPRQRAAEAIVVAQPGRELFDLVNEVFGRTRPVCHAADVSAALQAIEDEEVGVLLCDLDRLPGADVMLRMLKQSHPEVQAVTLSDHSDAEGLIALINEAQVLRFLSKPVRPGLLERAVRSALVVHANCKAAPVLARRQAVRPRADIAAGSLGQQILQRLASFVSPGALAAAWRR
jgi:serine/threonine protein kinase/FixJ family two-component response regulator